MQFTVTPKLTRFIWLKNQANALSKNAKKEVNAIKLANIAPTFPTVFKAPVDILSNILVSSLLIKFSIYIYIQLIHNF